MLNIKFSPFCSAAKVSFDPSYPWKAFHGICNLKKAERPKLSAQVFGVQVFGIVIKLRYQVRFLWDIFSHIFEILLHPEKRERENMRLSTQIRFL